MLDKAGHTRHCPRKRINASTRSLLWVPILPCWCRRRCSRSHPCWCCCCCWWHWWCCWRWCRWCWSGFSSAWRRRFPPWTHTVQDMTGKNQLGPIFSKLFPHNDRFSWISKPQKFGDILFHFQDILVYRFFNSAHFFMFNFLIFMLLKVCAYYGIWMYWIFYT